MCIVKKEKKGNVNRCIRGTRVKESNIVGQIIPGIL